MPPPHRCLQVPYIILEKDEPGSSWATRYDRLHLHTITYAAPGQRT